MNRYALKKILSGVTGLLLLLSSCQKEVLAPDPDGAAPEAQKPVPGAEFEKTGSPADFPFRIFALLRAEGGDKNLLISPWSISAALTMTYNGADGTTKTGMRGALGLELPTDEEINRAYKDLADKLIKADEKVNFTSANSIWYTDKVKLQAPFLQQSQTYFNATIEALNFSSAAAKNTINDWAKEKTKGKIQNVVPAIEPDDRLFLINAIYFKGSWTYPFDKSLTHKAPFYKADGSIVNVDFMTLKKGQYYYFQEPNRQADIINLPYGNSQFSMTIVLPKGQTTVPDIVRSLNQKQLTAWLANGYTTQNLELQLPKFKLEYKKEFNEVLTQMGMGEAFTKHANFSRMLDGSTERLFISKIAQKTFLEVNEEGAEAAAVTVVVTSVDSKPLPVLVNRPFVFLIREKSTNAILFIGQLMEP